MPRDISFKNLSVREAGRRGGLSVLAKHGHKHFSKIGKQGQKALRERYPDMASEWGKQGGRPRKPQLHNMGDQNLNNKRGGSGSASNSDPPPV